MTDLDFMVAAIGFAMLASAVGFLIINIIGD